MSASPLDGRCGAKTPGGFCEQRPLQGLRRCRRHRGSPGGAAALAFKHGKHSKYLPPRMQERYQAALTDPTLLSSRDDLALMDARLEDLLRRADTGESGQTWEKLQQARAELLSARQLRDAERVQAALQEMLSLIAKGGADHLTWRDIRETVSDRNKLATSERKRMIELQQMVQVDRLVTFMQTLASILISEIPDKSLARRVVGRVQTLMTIDGTSERLD
jgi:hypothetical protein